MVSSSCYFLVATASSSCDSLGIAMNSSCDFQLVTTNYQSRAIHVSCKSRFQGKC